MQKHKILLAAALVLAVASTTAACDRNTSVTPESPGEEELRSARASIWLCTRHPNIYACSGRLNGTAAGTIDLCCPPGNAPCYEETAAGCSPGEYQGKCRSALKVGDDAYVCDDD